MAADIECGFLLASVGEGLRQYGIAPDCSEEQAIIAELRRDREVLARRCKEQSRQMFILLTQENRRLTVSAEEAVAAIMARADEDGAMHRDAMLDVLRKMGAR